MYVNDEQKVAEEKEAKIKKWMDGGKREKSST